MRKSFFDNDYFLNVLTIGLLLLVWWLIGNFEWAKESKNQLWFASLDEVIQAIQDIFTTKLVHVFTSFKLIIKSSAIVVLLGSLIGFFVGYFEFIYRSIKWSLDFWRSIPPIIVIGILVNLDGREELFWRIWLVLFGALPIMIMQVADSIYSSSKTRLMIFESIKPGFIFKMRHVIIWEILPSLFSTTRTILSFAIIIIIVSEMVYAPSFGIGEQILHFQTASEIQYVYAYALIVGLIGLSINEVFRFIEKRIFNW